MATDGFLFSRDHFSIILPYLGWECCFFKPIWLVNKEALQAFKQYIKYFDQLVKAEGLYGQLGWHPTDCYNFEGMPQTTSHIILWEDAWPWLKEGLDHAINMALFRNAKRDILGIDCSEFSNYDGVRNRLYAINYPFVYSMCTQRTPYCYSDAMYIWLTGYIKEWALRLKGSNGYNCLSEVNKEKCWKIISKNLGKVFSYLDRYYAKHHNLLLIEALAEKVKVEILD